MTIETLRLLECLLEKPVEDILDLLLLKHLTERKYFKHLPVVNGEGTPVNGDVTTSREDGSKVDELDRIELEKIVNRWAPEDLQLCIIQSPSEDAIVPFSNIHSFSKMNSSIFASLLF